MERGREEGGRERRGRGGGGGEGRRRGADTTGYLSSVRASDSLSNAVTLELSFISDFLTSHRVRARCFSF